MGTTEQPPSEPRRVIAHLDCDAFYASVELRRRPDLRGQPLVVAGSGPRSVVTTASYEARRYGVRSAMAAAHARRLCPQAVFLEPDFPAYIAASREIWALARKRLGTALQSVSLDEAYADVTAVERPLATLRALVAEVRERTGITLSVGVGPSRLVAKTASDAEKPAGFVVLSREQACERFASAPTRLLQGVGPRTQERLAALGIHTVEQLRHAPEDVLVARFGARTGEWLRRLASFHDSSAVQTSRIAKSRSTETTFDTDVADPLELESVVRRQAERLCAALQRRGTRGRTIAIKVRLDDWTTVTRARTLETATADTEVVLTVAVELLRAYAPARPVRLIGVRVAAFEHDEGPDGQGDDSQLELELAADRSRRVPASPAQASAGVAAPAPQERAGAPASAPQ